MRELKDDKFDSLLIVAMASLEQEGLTEAVADDMLTNGIWRVTDKGKEMLAATPELQGQVDAGDNAVAVLARHAIELSGARL